MNWYKVYVQKYINCNIILHGTYMYTIWKKVYDIVDKTSLAFNVNFLAISKD